jgi:hypothetical protein
MSANAAFQDTYVTVVRLPPAPGQYISGVVAVASEIVKPVEVPGFMTYPTAAGFSKGDEPARPNEKVMLYVAGGSVFVCASCGG